MLPRRQPASKRSSPDRPPSQLQIAYGDLAWVQMGLGRYADAEATMREAASLRPDDQINSYALATVQALLGKYAEARTTLSAIKDESDREYHLAYVDLLQGHKESGLALLEKLITRPRDDIGALYIARLYAIGDYRDQALEWIDKAFERGERDVEFLKLLPEFRGLRNDAGFAQRVARLKLPEHPDPL